MTALCWYRLGEGTLGVAAADDALTRRFEEIYGHCAVAAPLDGPRVICRAAAPDAGRVVVRFEDPEPLDVAPFLTFVFPERNYRPSPDDAGRTRLRLPDTTDDVILEGDNLIAPAGAAWQPLAANLAVSRLFRLQHGLFFFHAASFAVHGRGVMACGPKRSGKTTVALSMAARGHALLGDEVAALRLRDRALLPFQRSLAVREGPASAATGPALAGAAAVLERFPDGELRQRVPIARVSSLPVPEQVPLTAVLILRHFTAQTSIRPLTAGPQLIGALTPMAASLWDRPAGAVAVRLLGALAGARLYEVDAGPPDEVADTIERLLEDG